MRTRGSSSNSIIGIFDGICSGIRPYCSALHKELGGERIDFGGFYLKYKGITDGTKKSDKKLSFLSPFTIPKGKNVWFNIIDSRLTILCMPTLFVSKLLGKKIIGIAHHTRQGKVDFLSKTFFNKLFPYFLFDEFVVHGENTIEGKPTRKRPIDLDVPDLALPKNKARELLQIPQDMDITLAFGHIRRYKELEKACQEFLKCAGKNDAFLIVGKKWYNIHLPKDYRIKLRDYYVPEPHVMAYFRACDRVYIGYGKESGIYALAKKANKPIIRRFGKNLEKPELWLAEEPIRRRK